VSLSPHTEMLPFGRVDVVSPDRCSLAVQYETLPNRNPFGLKEG